MLLNLYKIPVVDVAPNIEYYVACIDITRAKIIPGFPERCDI